MSREKGDEFEKQLEKDLGIPRTAKSGGHWDNGDLADRSHIIEAKVKSTPTFRSPGKEIDKLKAQADKHGKDWIYIQKNDSGTYVLLDYNYFLYIWEVINQ